MFQSANKHIKLVIISEWIISIHTREAEAPEPCLITTTVNTSEVLIGYCGMNNILTMEGKQLYGPVCTVLITFKF